MRLTSQSTLTVGTYAPLSRKVGASSDTSALLLPLVTGRSVDPRRGLLSSSPHRRGLKGAITGDRLRFTQQVRFVPDREDNVCEYRTAVAQCERLGINDLIVV